MYNMPQVERLQRTATDLVTESGGWQGLLHSLRNAVDHQHHVFGATVPGGAVEADEGLDMRAMHGRYWSYLGNDLQGRPRAADRQGITGRFNAVEPKMEGTPHTGRSDADRSNSADLEVGTKCAAELSTSSCGADDAGDGVAACTRANSVPMLLGVGDAGKAAGYYMLKYMGKPLCDPAASLDVFVAAAQHVSDPGRASTAADAHTSRRTALHFAERVLNASMQELEAPFAASIVVL